jgi:CRISPR-associated protein Cas2
MAHLRPIPQMPWGWRSMWVIAMFDLPTNTPAERKAYTRFRKTLLDDGFTMMQFSVYSRHCASIDNAEIHLKRMGTQVPSEGEVRFMTITDHQFGRIRVFVGKKRQPNAASPSQLEFF